METMAWTAPASRSSQRATWAVMHWDTNSLLWLSRHHKQTVHLTCSHKWLGSTRRGWRGRGHDHWALALGEEAPSLPSHLSTVKCVGKTFITSMALLRVNSHCNNNRHMRTYKKKKKSWAGPCPDLATSSLPWLKQENSVSSTPCNQQSPSSSFHSRAEYSYSLCPARPSPLNSFPCRSWSERTDELPILLLVGTKAGWSIP